MKSPQEWEDNLNKKLLKNYSVSLMNNSKWFKVWGLICKYQLRIQMNYADDPNYGGRNTLQAPFDIDIIWEKGIRDPGVGGPFYYKQTLWIRIPKIQKNNISSFTQELQKLGSYPLSETDKYIEITGYK